MKSDFDFVCDQLKEQDDKLERIRLALGVPKGGPKLEDVAQQFHQYAQAWCALSEVVNHNFDPLIAANQLRREVEFFRKRQQS